MQQAQTIFSKLQKNKKKLAELKKQLNDEYKQNTEYLDVDLRVKTEQKKRAAIRKTIDEQFPDMVNEINDLKIDIASDKEMLNDIILSNYLKGESVELFNEYAQAQLPIFEVKFIPKD